MKNAVRKITSVVIVAAMFLCSTPLTGLVGLELPNINLFSLKAKAESATSGTCGENLTWVFDESTGTLTISGTGEMTNWESTEDVPWYLHSTNAKTVNVGDGVTSIGDFAFAFCDNLVNVLLPEGLTVIGKGSFGCSGIESITLPDSLISIGESAFYECVNLKSINIPKSLTTLGEYAFYNSGLEIILLDNEKIKFYESPFLYCKNLSTAVLSENITMIPDYIFYGCSSLRSITINENITQIGVGSFGDNISLTTVNFNAKNCKPTKSGTDFTAFFTDCPNITTVNIGSSVTVLPEYCFAGLERIVEVKIPESVKTIGSHAFAYCKNLNNIEIHPNVISIGSYSFFDTAFYNDETNWKNDLLYVNKYLLHARPNALITYDISSDTKVISGSAFSLCNNVTEIVIPDGVVTIGDFAFSECYNLVTAQIPQSVENIGDSTFAYCNSLKKINLDSNNKFFRLDTYGALYNFEMTRLIHFPSKCTATDYIVPYGVTEIDGYAFPRISETLRNITIPKTVKKIGEGAFILYYCYNNIYYEGTIADWCEIDFPESLSIHYYTENLYINNKKVFGYFYIPDEVTTIKKYTFFDCNDITTLFTGNNVKIIEEYAFFDCSQVKKIIIGNKTEYIGTHAFENCAELTSITIPKSVKVIDDYALGYGTKLTDVYFTGTEEDWSTIKIGEGNKSLANATVHFNCIPEHSHSYSSTVTKDASCAETGIMTYTCECGDSYTEEIAKIPHSDGEWETVVEATCTAQGKKVKKCTVCGTVTANEIIPVITHSDNNSDGFCDSCDRITDEDLINGIYIAISPVKEHIINYMESVTLTATTANLPEGYTVKWVAEGEGVTIKTYGNKCKVTSTSTGRVVIKAYVVDAKGRVVTDENSKPVCDSEYFHSDANFWLRIIYFFKQLFKFY